MSLPAPRNAREAQLAIRLLSGEIGAMQRWLDLGGGLPRERAVVAWWVARKTRQREELRRWVGGDSDNILRDD